MEDNYIEYMKIKDKLAKVSFPKQILIDLTLQHAQKYKEYVVKDGIG